jgi:hypothetical protein
LRSARRAISLRGKIGTAIDTHQEVDEKMRSPTQILAMSEYEEAMRSLKRHGASPRSPLRPRRIGTMYLQRAPFDKPRGTRAMEMGKPKGCTASSR